MGLGRTLHAAAPDDTDPSDPRQRANFRHKPIIKVLGRRLSRLLLLQLAILFGGGHCELLLLRDPLLRGRGCVGSRRALHLVDASAQLLNVRSSRPSRPRVTRPHILRLNRKAGRGLGTSHLRLLGSRLVWVGVAHSVRDSAACRRFVAAQLVHWLQLCLSVV